MSHYTLANLDWVFMRVTAAENWDIGWTLDGNEFNISSTCAGRPARAAHSAERALTCSWDGTSPVTKSQKRDSFYRFNKISCVYSKKWGYDEILNRTWKWFTAGDGSWENFLAFWDGFSTESDTFICVKNGSFPNHTLDTSHTTISHIDSNMTELK